MKLLYPHLFDYFSFVDFESARVEGGASHWQKSSNPLPERIVNKVIAIFGNDTVAQEFANRHPG